MTSSTSLYPQPSGNANVASRNFTTLYSGSGDIVVQEPGQYGNANVVALLAASTDGANTIGIVSATGNIKTSAYFIGDGGYLSNVASAYGNANVSAYLASGTNTANIITTGNVSGTYVLGNGSQLTGLPATYGNANVTTLLANLGSNAISTTGNVTAGYFIGNGSQLTGIASSYGNANVSAYLASGTNTADMITTANIIGGNLKTSGASGNIVGADYVSANFYLGDGGLLSNITSSYGNANVSAYLSSGNITANILTTGNISATGNVTGNYILGNGSQLTGLPATYGNTNVVSLLASFGSNSISTTGNVTASYFTGNGSLLTNITGANVTGVVANATYAATAGSAGSATTAVTVTGNAQANITSVGTLTGLSVSGNVQGGNILTGGLISATGNITGAYFIGNGVSLTDLARGSNTQIQFNNAGNLAGNAAMTFETVAGNIGLGNLIIGSNATGNANTGGTAQRINTIAPDNGTLSTATAFGNGQIVIGNGYFGNLSLAQTGGLGINGTRGAKFLVWDSANIAESGAAAVRWSGVSSAGILTLTGNVALNSTIRSGISGVVIGGGTSANTWNSTNGFTGISGQNSFVNVGSGNPSGLNGNTTVNNAIGGQSQINVFAGSNLGNTAGIFAEITGSGNITNSAGCFVTFSGISPTTPTRAYGLYMPGATASPFAGTTNANSYRAATNYYFLRNDDAVAQTQLGTLRSYNEYNYVNPTTTGALTIDKVNAQVQQINLTGNISGITYANMVTSLSDSVNTDEELDTVTIIFNQGATGGFGVTFPAGATYKYSGGVTALTSTAANSVSVVTVRAVRIGGTATYLTNIEPAFV